MKIIIRHETGFVTKKVEYGSLEHQRGDHISFAPREAEVLRVEFDDETKISVGAKVIGFVINWPNHGEKFIPMYCIERVCV